MAGCFYHIHLHSLKHFTKRRTKSLEELPSKPQPDSKSTDQPDMTLLANNKFPGKLGRLFRSKSEQGLKSSPRSSPMNSPKSQAPRRRLLRVVRDDQHEGEEWENPHVVRRYSKQYWEKQMEEARTIQHSVSQPYNVNTDHTILKKTNQSSGSTDSESEAGSNSPTINKHACFKDQVQVIEFVGKEKISKRLHYMHETRLVDSEEEELETVCEETVMDIKEMLKLERINEFSKAKESLETVDSDDDDVNIPCEHHLSSDALSDTSTGCSDTDEPKTKQKKKSLRVRFFHSAKISDSKNSSDKNTTDVTDSNVVKPYVHKCLLSLHEQVEVDLTDSDSGDVTVTHPGLLSEL